MSKYWPKIVCCGAERSTPYCPVCGRAIGDNVVPDLVAQCDRRSIPEPATAHPHGLATCMLCRHLILARRTEPPGGATRENPAVTTLWNISEDRHGFIRQAVAGLPGTPGYSGSGAVIAAGHGKHKSCETLPVVPPGRDPFAIGGDEGQAAAPARIRRAPWAGVGRKPMRRAEGGQG